MTTTAVPTPEAAYESVRKILVRACRQFKWRCGGGDLSEYLSVAHEQFLEAYRMRAAAGDFTDFARFVESSVWFALRKLRHKERRRETILQESAHDLAPRRSGFDLRTLLAELSDDAKTVVGALLAAEPTQTLAKRNWAVRYLNDLGWAGRRIAEAFREVGEAL